MAEVGRGNLGEVRLAGNVILFYSCINIGIDCKYASVNIFNLVGLVLWSVAIGFSWERQSKFPMGFFFFFNLGK